MGILSGSVSFVRYQVEGEIADNFWEFADEKIRLYSFHDIDDTFEEKSIGWVSVMNMFDHEFTQAPFSVGDYIILTMRIDERKVPNAVLKKFCLKEEERIKKERQLPKLNRAQQMEIKENVHLMLLKKSIPVPATYDLCWNLSEGSLTFYSTNKKAQETLEDFFKNTFDMRLVLQIPYLTAEQLLDQDEQLSLADINSTIFI
jgi:DNA recombination-dependent growth factor C